MLLLCFVGAVNAEVTKYYKPGERLSTLTEGQKVMFYNTSLPDGQDRTGFLVDNAGNFALNKQKPSAAPFFSEKVGVWTLENVTLTDGAYTVNVKGANGYVKVGTTFDSYTYNGNTVVFKLDRSLDLEYPNKGFGMFVDLTTDSNGRAGLQMFTFKGGQLIHNVIKGVGGADGLTSGEVSSPVAGSKIVNWGLKDCYC